MVLMDQLRRTINAAWLSSNSSLTKERGDMEQIRILLVGSLLTVLAMYFPPAYSLETDLLMVVLFAIALVCSLGRIYLSHSRMTVATAMPRSSASERW